MFIRKNFEMIFLAYILKQVSAKAEFSSHSGLS